VAILTAIYLDFQDAACYRAWRWLSLLEERERVDPRPYSLDSDDGERRNPWDRTTPSWGLELLALGELARDVGAECHRNYIDAVFVAVHDEHWDLSSPEAWLALCAAVQIDLERFTEDGERWRAEVGLWHQEAEDEYDVEGVPSLVFDNDRALYLKLDQPVTDAVAARRLLADLTDLAAQPVGEVRRTV
jgi:hypothetical protein